MFFFLFYRSFLAVLQLDQGTEEKKEKSTTANIFYTVFRRNWQWLRKINIGILSKGTIAVVVRFWLSLSTINIFCQAIFYVTRINVSADFSFISSKFDFPSAQDVNESID